MDCVASIEFVGFTDDVTENEGLLDCVPDVDCHVDCDPLGERDAATVLDSE